jgi:hypothetical protein
LALSLTKAGERDKSNHLCLELPTRVGRNESNRICSLEGLLKDRGVSWFFSSRPQWSPTVRQGSLVFSNLGLEAGLVNLASYRYQWHRFDNSSGSLQPLGGERVAQVPKVELPEDGSPFLMVRIRTLSIGPKAWQEPVEIYLRNDATPRVVGISR